MTEAHKHFIELVEALISGRLAEMGLDMSMLEDILEQRMAKASDDATVLGLAEMLRKYADFREFGLIMRDKFLELYPVTMVAKEPPGVGLVSLRAEVSTKESRGCVADAAAEGSRLIATLPDTSSPDARSAVMVPKAEAQDASTFSLDFSLPLP